MTIPEAEIRYSKLSLVDIGRVFWWQGRLFRAFTPDSVARIRAMFDSGLVADLVSAGLLVDSWMTELQVNGYGLVVEHEVIPTPLYPREWSFSMLQDAARLILRLNERARRFGYQTKDCNGYNVLFNRGQPIFVDLSSFVEVPADEDVLLSYEEFLLSYYYPLQIWRTAGQYLGSKAIPRAGGLLIAPEAYLRYRWPFYRLVPDAVLIQGFKILNSIRTLRHNDLGKLRKRHAPWVVGLLSHVKSTGLLRGAARIGALQRTIDALKNRTGQTMWSNYHDGFSDGGRLSASHRFHVVVDRLHQLGIRSVLEFAGNQGVLSRLLRQRMPDIRIVCTDPDGSAIDKGYRASVQANEGIDWGIFNPFAHEGSPVEATAEDRFKADAVAVLALTHHLTLSQNLRLDYVFDVIGQYAAKYVFIEFMPLGLHDGVSAPDLPDWYNESWFSAAFCRRFTLLDKIQLEPNRVLFVGAVDTPDRVLPQ